MPSLQLRPGAVSAGAVALSAAISGLGSYVLLIVVAKNVTPVAYADFAVFWSIAVTVGLGAYFPVEQETARDFAGRERSPRGRLRTTAFSFAALLTVALIVLTAAVASVPAGSDFLGTPALAVALGIAFVGYLLQFPTRGLLSGSRNTAGYAAVIGTEGVLRVAIPLVIVAVGWADPAAFAATVGLAAALSIAPLAARRFRVSGSPDGRLAPFAARTMRLVAAALAIQLLINSGVLIARFFDASAPLLAGQVLTCLSIARIPVFAYQALQVLYMPRLAAAWKAGAVDACRRLILVVVAVIGAVGVVAVVGLWLLGPAVIGLFFAPDLVLPTVPLVVLTAGVAVFLLAQALSDATLAFGGHTVLLLVWLVALAAAVVSVIVIGDPALRAVAPLGIGAIVACAGFGLSLRARLRTGAQSGFSAEQHLK